MSQQAVPESDIGTVEADVMLNDDELMRRFRTYVRRDLATQLAAGHPVYYGGIGEDADKLFVHLPDGRRFEYHVTTDGAHEMIRELPR